MTQKTSLYAHQIGKCFGFRIGGGSHTLQMRCTQSRALFEKFSFPLSAVRPHVSFILAEKFPDSAPWLVQHSARGKEDFMLSTTGLYFKVCTWLIEVRQTVGGCGAAEGNSKPCKPFSPTQYYVIWLYLRMEIGREVGWVQPCRQWSLGVKPLHNPVQVGNLAERFDETMYTVEMYHFESTYYYFRINTGRGVL